MKPMLKLLLVGALLLVLAVPVMMLQGLVYERQQRGQEAAEDIARSSSRAQLVVGPLLRVEIERRVRKVRLQGGTSVQGEVEIVRQVESRLITPLRLDIDGELASERRRRGLFEAMVYHADLRLQANFAALVLPPPEADVVDQRILSASLILGLGDARGVRAIEGRIDGVPTRAEPGTSLGWWPVGLQMRVDPARLTRELAFDANLVLDGTESLQWVPVGDETRIGLKGDWDHPSFIGNFLPTFRVVGDAAAGVESATASSPPAGTSGGSKREEGAGTRGFRAEWKVSRLAAQTASAMRDCGVAVADCGAAAVDAFGVRLIDPVDRYVKTDRAIKYAWLFIVLVFGALFFLELLRPVRLHALQYGLTGLALAMFFLLLLSLAEHVGFGPAYAIAAVACIALIGIYVAAALGSRARSFGFVSLLAGLYGLLYGLLRSEDYALLMGALALFGLLATAMLLTRRLDWHRLGGTG
jgi:inner membrane protein